MARGRSSSIMGRTLAGLASCRSSSDIPSFRDWVERFYQWLTEFHEVRKRTRQWLQDDLTNNLNCKQAEDSGVRNQQLLEFIQVSVYSGFFLPYGTNRVNNLVSVSSVRKISVTLIFKFDGNDDSTFLSSRFGRTYTIPCNNRPDSD